MASLDQPSQCIVMHRSVISVMHQLMIINEEFMASLDQSSQCIVMHMSVSSVMHQLMILNEELMATWPDQPIHC